MMNVTSEFAVCAMPEGPTENDYGGSGAAVAYIPALREASVVNKWVKHEAGGHGMGKLGDEYVLNVGAIPETVKTDVQDRMRRFGWYKNLDFTGDRTKVKWAKYLTDPRYAGQGLGVYEGGYYYPRGVWRSTQQSVMLDGEEFNAPSREAIWYRIHKLARGEGWQYDHEAFVEWDLSHRTTRSTTRATAPPAGVRHVPPVVIPRKR
jgi:hypothetical protein